MATSPQDGLDKGSAGEGVGTNRHGAPQGPREASGPPISAPFVCAPRRARRPRGLRHSNYSATPGDKPGSAGVTALCERGPEDPLAPACRSRSEGPLQRGPSLRDRQAGATDKLHPPRSPWGREAPESAGSDTILLSVAPFGGGAPVQCGVVRGRQENKGHHPTPCSKVLLYNALTG